MGVAGHEGILISQPVLPAGGVCGVHQRGHEVRGIREGERAEYKGEVEEGGAKYSKGESMGGRKAKGGRVRERNRKRERESEGETWEKREGRSLVTLALSRRLSGNGEPGSETSAPGVPSTPPPSSSSSSSARPPDQQTQAISYPNMPAPSSTDQRQQQLMQQGQPMAALLISTDNMHSSPLPPPPILTTPAATTLEENAATAHRVLEQYQKQTVSPPHRKDLNFEFPPGLFPEKEVDLEGSLQAYHILQQGMENPEQFLNMFVQREADPFHQQHMFRDIDFNVFD